MHLSSPPTSTSLSTLPGAPPLSRSTTLARPTLSSVGVLLIGYHSVVCLRSPARHRSLSRCHSPGHWSTITRSLAVTAVACTTSSAPSGVASHDSRPPSPSHSVLAHESLSDQRLHAHLSSWPVSNGRSCSCSSSVSSHLTLVYKGAWSPLDFVSSSSGTFSASTSDLMHSPVVASQVYSCRRFRSPVHQWRSSYGDRVHLGLVTLILQLWKPLGRGLARIRPSSPIALALR